MKRKNITSSTKMIAATGAEESSEKHIYIYILIATHLRKTLNLKRKMLTWKTKLPFGTAFAGNTPMKS